MGFEMSDETSDERSRDAAYELSLKWLEAGSGDVGRTLEGKAGTLVGVDIVSADVLRLGMCFGR